MPREIMWTDVEEIGIQLQEKFPDIDPLDPSGEDGRNSAFQIQRDFEVLREVV